MAKNSGAEDTIKVGGGRLIVNVALTEPTLSSSGKTIVVYSTRGNKAINDGYFIGINLYTYPTRERAITSSESLGGERGGM